MCLSVPVADPFNAKICTFERGIRKSEFNILKVCLGTAQGWSSFAKVYSIESPLITESPCLLIRQGKG